MGQRRYRAFLSYSHRDSRVAAWLHRALESYDIPHNLVGTRTIHGEVPRRLTPIFKDREELRAAHSLAEAIENALGASDALIVLCSPEAKSSPWVGISSACAATSACSRYSSVESLWTAFHLV